MNLQRKVVGSVDELDQEGGRPEVRLLAECGKRGKVYNVGTGTERTSGQVLDVLLGLADADRPVVEIRPGFQQNPIADVTRLVQATGWKPEIPLEKTVADTLTWWEQFGKRAED